MFSLVITVVAIALVAVLALATLYYGGSGFGKGAARAEAAKLVLQGQQLLGAADLYYTANRRWPASIDELLSGNYLKQVPNAGVSGVSEALAAGQTWSMVSGSPTFYITTGSPEVCAEVNLSASLRKKGILRQAYSSLVAQCYGAQTSALQTVFRKSADMPFAPGTDVATNPNPPADPTDPAWYVAPGAVVPPGGSGGGSVTVLLEWAPTHHFPDTMTGAWSATTMVVRNGGNTPVTLSGLTSSNPAFTGALAGGAASFPSCETATPLAPGATCALGNRFTPSATGAANATYTLSYTSTAGASSVTAAAFGTGVAAAGTAVAGLTVVPNPVKFPLTPAGDWSFVTPRVYNNSGRTMVITSFDASANEVFTWSEANSWDDDGCGTVSTVPSGGSCVLYAEFDPIDNSTQTVNAIVSGTLDGEAFTMDIPMTGTGADAVVGLPSGVTVTPLSVDFGDVIKGDTARVPVLLTNHSGRDQTVADWTPTDWSRFPVAINDGTPQACAWTIANGVSCRLYVQFRPDATQAFSGQAQLTLQSDQTYTATVALSGTGVYGLGGFTPRTTAGGLRASWTTYNWALDSAMAVTHYAVPQLTLTNESSQAITLTDWGSYDPVFEVTPGNCTTIQPGQSCNPTVSFTPPELAAWIPSGVWGNQAYINTDLGVETVILQLYGGTVQDATGGTGGDNGGGDNGGGGTTPWTPDTYALTPTSQDLGVRSQGFARVSVVQTSFNTVDAQGNPVAMQFVGGSMSGSSAFTMVADAATVESLGHASSDMCQVKGTAPCDLWVRWQQRNNLGSTESAAVSVSMRSSSLNGSSSSVSQMSATVAATGVTYTPDPVTLSGHNFGVLPSGHVSAAHGTTPSVWTADTYTFVSATLANATPDFSIVPASGGLPSCMPGAAIAGSGPYACTVMVQFQPANGSSGAVSAELQVTLQSPQGDLVVVSAPFTANVAPPAASPPAPGLCPAGESTGATAVHLHGGYQPNRLNIDQFLAPAGWYLYEPTGAMHYYANGWAYRCV